MNTTQILGRLTKSLGWLVLAMLLGTAGWWLAVRLWNRYAPPRAHLTEVQRNLVQRWLPDVLSDLKATRGTYGSVLVPHLEGDATSELTDALRDAIRESGILWVNPRTFDSMVRLATEDLHRALRVKVASPESLHEALALAQGLDVDTVLFGRVHRLEGDAQGARLEVELCLAEVRSGTVLHRRRYWLSWLPGLGDPATIRDAVAAWTQAERFLAWALTGLPLPVVLWPVVRAVVRRESNVANAWLVGALTAGQAAVAWLLLVAGPASWWSVALLLGLLTIAFFYNLRVMTTALDRGHE